ncbi:Glutaminyl-tRNA synthetase [Ophidiomyces ophidiicola]|nr:Glutaminyl-tRNA synthetase [Ophidiomyces ophidiicola]
MDDTNPKCEEEIYTESIENIVRWLGFKPLCTWCNFVIYQQAWGDEPTIEIPKFESAVRTYLETLVPRLMLVLDPICVIIDNLPDDYIEMIEIPFSKDASHGSHFVPFTKTVFIDRSDFREAPSKTFYRLSPGESVGLMKVQYPIIATSFELDPITDLVCTIRAIYANDSSSNKIDGSIKSYVALVGNCGSRERCDDILR